ncbi:MAG TPA: hypothetical protein VHS09_09280 [Polyangiaceae bacterium]|nr:hypothetical protein [Polyangiaceae bacterium]
MRTRRRLLFASVVVLVAACGSRTGLLVPVDFDAGVDAKPDGSIIRHVDAMPGEEDALDEAEALPPLDVRPPPPDVAVPSDCVDAGATLIYLISATNHLFSFYPPTATFTQLGTIACPDPTGSDPFSMAVDRKGIAYIVFQSGALYRVSTANAACIPTGFAMNQQGFPSTFGMGFSQDEDGGETLFVASDSAGSQLSQLATIDVAHGYTLDVVGNFEPQINMAELTGTGAGGLFGFWDTDPGATGSGNDSAIVQIDKQTAQVTNSSPLPGLSQGTAWAFAFWGGSFYTFTAPGSSTVVHRFDPTDGTVVQVASTDDRIVGAGVSTCAPQQ